MSQWGAKAAYQWASHGPNPRQGLLPLARGTRDVRTLAIAVANPPFSLPKDKGFSEWFECVSELFVLFNLTFCVCLCSQIGVSFGPFSMAHQLHILMCMDVSIGMDLRFHCVEDRQDECMDRLHKCPVPGGKA
jgi:hypothetical protein